MAKLSPLPPSGAVASVSIIDSTTKINKLPTHYLMKPPMAGMEVMPEIPTWSFLVESATTGRKALFDLGVPPNWREHFAPVVADKLVASGWEIGAEKHVVDILRENGVQAEAIDAVVWRYAPFPFAPSTHARSMS